MLSDPEYNAAQSIANRALPGQTGLVVALEKTRYAGSPTALTTGILPGWGIDRAMRLGADAVMMLILYHPDAGELTECLERLTVDVIDECQRADQAQFLEPVSYNIDQEID